ncbi:MAG: XylR N-terminal domain-containing protein [Lachnospiraceae bacterium]|nr:XylR N-terminal domain-containing protein [Lachnospiraceae bacterium]
MRENVFFEDKKKLSLMDYMNFDTEGRGNLGEEVPVAVYRLMEYSLREELIEQFGAEAQVEIFRKSGYRAGVYFAQHILDVSLELNEFVASLQARMQQLKMGVLRIEELDSETGTIILTVAEDADCSGLPLLGETVCNYDEGFISGVLSAYFKREYVAIEVDCWATGDRVCRFHVKPKE